MIARLFFAGMPAAAFALLVLGLTESGALAAIGGLAVFGLGWDVTA